MGQQSNGGMPPMGNPMQPGVGGNKPMFQNNPWAAGGQGGTPGATSSMYPNQSQYAPKPFMDSSMSSAPANAAEMAGAQWGGAMPGGMGQSFAPPQQGRMFAGGPGGFRGMPQPVGGDPQAMPGNDIASLLQRYRRT